VLKLVAYAFLCFGIYLLTCVNWKITVGVLLIGCADDVHRMWREQQD